MWKSPQRERVWGHCYSFIFSAQPWSHDPGTCWAHTQMCAGSFPCRALKVICEDEGASPQHAGDIWLRLVNSELQWYTCDEIYAPITVYSSECDTVGLTWQYFLSGLKTRVKQRFDTSINVKVWSYPETEGLADVCKGTKGFYYLRHKSVRSTNFCRRKLSAIQALIESKQLCRICSLESSWGLRSDKKCP